MAGYVGSAPVPQSIQEKESFTATAGQTTFNTSGYSSGSFVNVYLNGVRLINGTDYTATNGSDIVLTSAASASDVLDFEVFNEFQLVDQEFASSVTLKNGTHEDTDGGRESTLIFKGEQSGGEISTLAEIEASHDGTADDQKGDLIFRTNDGSDGSSPTEAARIDSGQNFLVSTTGTDPNNATSSSDAGVAIRSDGRVLAGVYQDFAADLNRISNDGEILRISKDGTTVGSIGSQGGDSLTIGNGDTGVLISAGNDVIHPWNTSTNAARDNAIDLGRSSHRFADLYLGGGAYIGGTVAANYLDDYERGLHTISINQGGIGFNSLYQNFQYIKIGDFVNVHGLLLVSSGGDTNDLRVNMPFTAKSGLNQTADATHGLVSSYKVPTGSGGIRCTISKGTDKLRFLKTVDNNVWSSLLGNELANGDHLYVNISYEVA